MCIILQPSENSVPAARRRKAAKMKKSKLNALKTFFGNSDASDPSGALGTKKFQTKPKFESNILVWIAVQNQRLSPYNNYSFHRSMPSITSETDSDAIVTIGSYCVRGAGSKTHYEYEVRISTSDERWSILRRYSRFRDLHIAMKARYGEKVASIPFPAKQLFANSETVAKSRKRQLEFYLRRLIDTCKNHPSCPLAYGGPVTKAALISFSPFFRKGVFENGKYGTS